MYEWESGNHDLNAWDAWYGPCNHVLHAHISDMVSGQWYIIGVKTCRISRGRFEKKYIKKVDGILFWYFPFRNFYDWKWPENAFKQYISGLPLPKIECSLRVG